MTFQVMQRARASATMQLAGVKVWYGGEGFVSWFLDFIHVLYIAHVLFIIIHSQIFL